jgi:AcrR family transcriptional regulator
MTTGLRERKKLATRTALHSAALRLVAEQGLDRVTVEDIADAADVCTRTFFNYFATKEDALVGSDPQSWARLAERLAAGLALRRAGEGPMSALRAVAVGLASDTTPHKDEVSLEMQVIEANPALLARLAGVFVDSEQALTAVVAERTGTDADRDLYPGLVAAAATAALRAALHRWRSSDFEQPLDQLVDEAFVALAAGLPEPRP